MTFGDIDNFIQERKDYIATEGHNAFYSVVFKDVKLGITEGINEWFQKYQENLGIKDGAEPFNSALDNITDMLAAEMLYVLVYQYNNISNKKEN